MTLMVEPLTERLDLTFGSSHPPSTPQQSRPSRSRRRYGHEDVFAWPARKRRSAFVLATTGVLLAVIAVRGGYQLRWGAVTGLDTGNFLTLGRAWLGHGVDGAGSTYPPLVPVLVALLGFVASPMTTLILVGALGTAVYGGAAAAVLWRAGCGWWSIPLCLVLAVGTAAGEAVAWGGIPQLIGLGLGLLALYLIAELLVAPGARSAWLLGGAVLVLGATSHLLLAITAAAAVLMLVLRLTWALPRPTSAGMRRLAGIWLRVLIPCLLLVPLYLELLTTVGDSFAERQEEQSHLDFFRAVDDVVRELPLLGRFAIVVSLLVPLLLWRERRRPLWLVSTALSVLLTAVAAVSPEPRFAYVLPLILVCSFGLLAAAGPVARRPVLRLVVRAALVATVAVTCLNAVALFPQQVRHYGSLVPAGTESALLALRSTTDPGDVVLVPPVRGLPFGWWVEGYGQRAAFVGSSALWLNFAPERERAALSVELFSQTDVLSDRWLAAVAAAGADVVYLPATYDGVPPAEWRFLERYRPELVLHVSPAALIVEVP